MFDAEELTMTNNVVAGSERFGFAVSGLECGGSNANYTWHNNVAHSVMVGQYAISDFSLLYHPNTL